MCKAWHQYNERPRALALLNLPLNAAKRSSYQAFFSFFSFFLFFFALYVRPCGCANTNVGNVLHCFTRSCLVFTGGGGGGGGGEASPSDNMT